MVLVVVYTNSGGEFLILSLKRKGQYCSHRKPRAKRLSRKNVEPTFPEENLRSSTERDGSVQKNFLGRFLDKRKGQTKPSNSDASNAPDRSTNRTFRESPLNLSNTIFPEIATNSNQQLSVKRLNKTEKPTESGNAQIKLPNENGNNKTNPKSAVSVQKINKSAKLDEENMDSDNTTEIDNQTIPSTSTPTTKTDPINVTKIPRNKSCVTDVRQLSRQRSVIVKSIRRNRSLSQDRQKSSVTGVNVTKIHKNRSKK